MHQRLRSLVAVLLVCGLVFVPLHTLAEGEGSDPAPEEQVDVTSEEKTDATETGTEAADVAATEDATAQEATSADAAASAEGGEELASEEATASDETVSGPNLLQAQAACVTDTYGNVIWESNADTEMPMASITKIMTAMVALDAGIPLDTQVPFIKTDLQEDAQVAGYAEGDAPTFEELLKVTLIYSGNDAALNLAYAVAGSKEAFADLMNQKAAEIGMTHTHFMNPHGLEEDGHYSSAADLCIMGRYAMEHYPFIRSCVQTPSVTIVANGDEVTLWTTDDLMDTYAGLRGIKTGKTESGASFLGSARQYHNTLYSCVLCCDTSDGRFVDTSTLLDWAFSSFEERDFSRSNWVLGSAPWSDGFWLRCPIMARRTATGTSYPDQDVTYTKVMYKNGTLASDRSTYGTAVWRQDSRLVASVSYQTGRRVTQDLSWSPLMLPVMTETEGLLGT